MPSKSGTDSRMEAAYFTGHQLALYLGMDPEARWVEKNSHRIPGRVKVGKLVLYRKADVEKRLLGGSLLLPKPIVNIQIRTRRG